ncbi:hypothetical protein E4U54_004421 [Claviceps lovelessii]|nr:hypothetical protein E4U54_004421 [Claviceps lovelessii]
MKLHLYLSSLLATAAAADSIMDLTDNLLFTDSLDQFIQHRNHHDFPTLDWWSDNCTSAPDNPFGFPFSPACNRHDFGYNNYRLQRRFKKDAKRRIDDRFHDDLMHQCDIGSKKWICKRLANIYTLSVRTFGGKDADRVAGGARKRAGDGSLLAHYDELVRLYEEEVRKAQASGELPPGDMNLKAGLEPMRAKMAEHDALMSLSDVLN